MFLAILQKMIEVWDTQFCNQGSGKQVQQAFKTSFLRVCNAIRVTQELKFVSY